MPSKSNLPPSVRILSLLVLIGLSACGTARPSAAALEAPSAVPATPTVETPTPAASPTTTSVPTATSEPTATPITGISELNDPALKAQIDRMAEGFLGTGKSSGLGVAVVVRNPATGQLQAMLLNYGTSAKDQGSDITPDTVYEIGSITKVFTGILLAEAVTAGQVQLDDPIQKYMPAGIHAPTYRDEQITLANLATHRSSLPRDADTDSLPDLYAWLNGYQLARRPGSQYVYSNLGYSLLGDILARLAGTDFGTLEIQSVSQPLGLVDTRETLTSDETERLAQGYGYDGSAADYFPDSGAMSGAGYLRSTLSDMTRFLAANMRPDSTPLAAAIRLAQTSQSEGRNPGTGAGLGWDIQHPGKPDEVVSKGGATSGFTSYISFKADGSSGFVLLSNGQYVESLVSTMLNMLRDK
jgi:CubicO group peptidase (beta-lactamase class C family)